ncbi:MAG: acetyl-CoA carboxylase carboxyltransferase subunit beta [Deltaproteobacteria bacterium]|nr:acetyl-CoA carboxylase carboxyltransferase subunit beta [Deltaproteobacteria bacterium]
MCAWSLFKRSPKAATETSDRRQLPDGLWTKCPKCSAITYTVELNNGSKLCPKCNYHYRLNAAERINVICDRNTFEEIDISLRSPDPLEFKDSVKYKDRIKKAEKTSGDTEAVRTGVAKISGRAVMLGVMNFHYMGGSMGVVVGEKLAHMIEIACEKSLPVVIVCASGGARMQEGIYSLMQMAKVSAALARLSQYNLPYIAVLTDPTTGGVAASFAMQADVIIAEPDALIGFAGPRVIEQTIKRKLPEGFQRAEFLLQHGMVDTVVTRDKLKGTLANLLDLLH